MRSFLALPLLVVCAMSVGGCRDAEQTRRAESRAASIDPASFFSAGSLAPDFDLPDLAGKRVKLSDFRGRFVLLNFWATWCAPCVAEMPALERVHQMLSAKQFSVVSVNVDPPKGKADIEAFLRENAISFPIGLDPSLTVPPTYGVSGFPETMLIDPDGKIITLFDHGEQAETVRVMGDRPWDAAAYRAELEKRIERVPPPTERK